MSSFLILYLVVEVEDIVELGLSFGLQLYFKLYCGFDGSGVGHHRLLEEFD